MPRTSAALQHDLVPPRGSEAVATDLYGGLVGEMVGEIEARLAAPDMRSGREDGLHGLSVAAGYLGLAAASLATAAMIGALL